MKKRGRKPKAWYEEQERLKKFKKERKERGEVVSSDSEMQISEEIEPVKDNFAFANIKKGILHLEHYFYF